MVFIVLIVLSDGLFGKKRVKYRRAHPSCTLPATLRYETHIKGAMNGRSKRSIYAHGRIRE